MFATWEAALLEEERFGVLATIAPDGHPRLVPVCYAVVQGEHAPLTAIAIAIDEKPKRAAAELARLRDLRRDSRCTLLVHRAAEDWERLAWVRVEAGAAVLEAGSARPDALDALRARYRQYAAMALEARPLILLDPTRVVSWRWKGAAT